MSAGELDDTVKPDRLLLLFDFFMQPLLSEQM